MRTRYSLIQNSSKWSKRISRISISSSIALSMKPRNTLLCILKLNLSSIQSKTLKLNPKLQPEQSNNSTKLHWDSPGLLNKLLNEYLNWPLQLWWWRRKKTILFLQSNHMRMDAGMKELLSMVKSTVKASWCSKMEHIMKDNSRRTRWTEKVCSTTTKITQLTMDSGPTINSTGMEFSTINTLSSWLVNTTSTKCQRSRTIGSNTKVKISLFRLILFRQ